MRESTENPVNVNPAMVSLAYAAKPVVFSVLRNLICTLVISDNYSRYLAHATELLNQSSFLDSKLNITYYLQRGVHHFVQSEFSPKLALNVIDNTEPLYTLELIAACLASVEQIANVRDLAEYLFYFVTSKLIVEGSLSLADLVSETRLNSALTDAYHALLIEALEIKRDPSTLLAQVLPNRSDLRLITQIFFTKIVADPSFLELINQILTPVLSADSPEFFTSAKVHSYPYLSANPTSQLQAKPIIESVPALVELIKPIAIAGIKQAMNQENSAVLIQRFLQHSPVVIFPTLSKRIAEYYVSPSVLANICDALADTINAEDIKQFLGEHLSESTLKDYHALFECMIGAGLANKGDMNYYTDPVTAIRAFNGMQKLLAVIKERFNQNRSYYVDLIASQISSSSFVRWAIKKSLNQILDSNQFDSLFTTVLQKTFFPFDQTVQDFYFALNDFNAELRRSFNMKFISKKYKTGLLEKFEQLHNKADEFNRFVASSAKDDDQMHQLAELTKLPSMLITHKQKIITVIQKGNINQYKRLYELLSGYEDKLAKYILGKQSLVAKEFKLSWWNSLVIVFKQDKDKYLQQLHEAHKHTQTENQTKVDTAIQIQQQASEAKNLMEKVDKSELDFATFAAIPQMFTKISENLKKQPIHTSTRFGFFHCDSTLQKINKALQESISIAA